jgi:GntR family transcriptional regulator
MYRQGVKHLAVRDTLAQDIEQGSLQHGERLPGEHELAQRFDVSRQTVRQALRNLQQAGYIATQPGAGSFVTYDDQHLDSTMSWSSALASQGVTTTTRVLRFELISDAALAVTLEQDSEMFLALDRVRMVDGGDPISLEHSRVPFRPQLTGLPAQGLTDGSLTTTLRERGLVAETVEEWAGVAVLETAAAHALRRDVGTPFLGLRSLVRDRQQTVLEHVTSWLDPDHFHFHSIHRRATGARE